jgi:type I restriction enzyme, S subunit
MKNIGQDTIKNALIVVPPVSEQREIVRFVTQTSLCFDELAREVEIAIGRLRELRSSPISSAVTDQIDVRNYREEAPCR